MAIQKLSRNDKIKRGVWAVAFAACVFVGTVTGAQMKQDKQKEEVRLSHTCTSTKFSSLTALNQAITTFRATVPGEQIVILNEQKKALLDQKAALQRKVDAFNERVRQREEEKARKAN